MRFAGIATFALLMLAGTTQAHAEWKEGSQFYEGTCSADTINSDTFASLLMDADGRIDMLLKLPGKRGEFYVINFSDGTNQAFRNDRSGHISFELSPTSLTAFRESNSFQVYQSGVGYLGSPVSLKGSSRALDTLISCARSTKQQAANAAAGETGKAIEPFSTIGITLGMNPDQVKTALQANGYLDQARTSGNTIYTEDSAGRKLTVSFSKGPSSSIVSRFYTNVSSADVDVSNVTADILTRYGPPSATSDGGDHKLWYRTASGQLLRSAALSYTTCPGEAASRLILRETKAGSKYFGGAGSFNEAKETKYEVAIDNCQSEF